MSRSAVVIYIETNFLMGIATGRDSHAESLLDKIASPVRLVIPAVCYMEAFSAFEEERRNRNRFKAHLEQHVSQLKRDQTSPHANSLVGHLEQSRIENDSLLNDIQNRLFQSIDRLSSLTELITLTPDCLPCQLEDAPRL